MRYRLIVLTHGDSRTLSSTIESFREHVSPEPTERWLIADRPLPPAASVDNPAWLDPYFSPGETAYSDPAPRGFCETVETAWNLFAAERLDVKQESCNYVFWLEHDFLFARHVDLSEIAEVLEIRPNLAQISLMRQPVSERERRAGSVLSQYGGGLDYNSLSDDGPRWIEHRHYFTTNPSLMRTRFVQDNLWPSVEEECEGRFGLGLIERGYSFGIWGSGEPWIAHVGKRTGFGY